MNQDELREKIFTYTKWWAIWWWGREINFPYGIPCFPSFRPHIKKEFMGIKGILHLGHSCTQDTFACFITFTDGRIQEMPPHPPGQCPWCEYMWFEEGK